MATVRNCQSAGEGKKEKGNRRVPLFLHCCEGREAQRHSQGSSLGEVEGWELALNPMDLVGEAAGPHPRSFSCNYATALPSQRSWGEQDFRARHKPRH